MTTRRSFFKMTLPVSIGMLILPYLSKRINESTRIIINCLLPRRLFQEGSDSHDFYLREILVDPSQKKMQFILSDNLSITYIYSDTFQAIAKKSQKDGMKMKILFSYSLYKMCQDDKRKEKRYQSCDGDSLQRQKFLENLSINKYADLLLSFNKK